MCGITGIVSLSGNPVSPVILKQMTDSIKHRGPDGEGSFIEDNVGLGHRRLAILDLTPAGHQPMQTKDGKKTITYNGEIYNFQELRVALEAQGHQFHSRTDSEVVLNAMAEWGIDALARFNGMFAFAFWDSEEKSLILARDRYGIKPLYYYFKNNSFLFGSEVKAILANNEYERKFDKSGLVEYLTFQNFFTDRTLFANIKLLPAGCYLKLNTRTGAVETKRYWDYHFSDLSEKRNEKEYLEELDHLFRQAINRQLVSDVPISSYLSGGMDSGSITVLASQQLPNLKSFTIGFDMNSASGLEMVCDEREKAEYISYLARTEHYEMVLKAGDMERAMNKLVWHLEEPRVGQSYPNYYAAKLASKFGKVVLSGTGGDEFFGGYPWRYYRAVVNNDFNDYVDKYYGYWQRLLTGDEVKNVLSPIWAKIQQEDTRQIFKGVFSSFAEQLITPDDFVNHSMYFEAKTFLHGLLVMEDKLSMAHGLETRVPFLDNDLVDFALKLPTKFKLGNLSKVIKLDENEAGNKSRKYFEKTKDGKLILRKLMERYIPKQITNSVKQGFSAPDASWFKGESIEFVKSTLLNSKAEIYNYMDYSSVKNLVLEHLEGKKNRRLLIWSLLYLEEWQKVFNVGL